MEQLVRAVAMAQVILPELRAGVTAAQLDEQRDFDAALDVAEIEQALARLAQLVAPEVA